MALVMTSFSFGSRCWAAGPGSASAHASNEASAARRRCPLRSGVQALAQEAEGLVHRELGAGAVAAGALLELAGLEAALRHHQAVRDTHKLRVRKLDPGARVAIVVQHLDPGGVELGIESVAEFAHTRGFLQIQGYQHYLERCDRRRPDDAALIVILLDRRSHDTRHTYAVAAHEQGHFLAGLIQHHRLHRAAVLVAELEEVADLDAAGHLQAPLAART